MKKMAGIQLQSPSPPIGLAYLGAFLKKNGYEYTAVDACGEAMSQVYPFRGSEKILIQGLKTEEVVALVPNETRVVGF